MNSKKATIVIAVVVILVILAGILVSATCSGKNKSDEKASKKVESTKETDTTKEVSIKETTRKDDETATSETESLDEETQSGDGESAKDETTSMQENVTNNSEERTTNIVDENNTTKPDATEKPTIEQATTGTSGGSNDNTDTSQGTMRNMTTAQIVREMGIGINLGNTFESCGTWINKSSVTNFETAWGSPVITKAMLQGMADEGFGVLRIPVAWSNMMDSDYNIDPSYIARVKEVVDWTLDSGMYAIVNIHYDSGWWENFPTDKENCMKKYKSIWTQLSAAFADYGDKLMFESLNEEGCWDSVWNRYGGATASKKTAFDLLNEINQTFVDVVRGSGSNNAYRHLLIAGYATDITLTCDSYFKMPNDPQGRCAVSVHYYTPSTYTILEKDESWGKAQTEWGSDADVAELKKYMKMMNDNFVRKGIPVIVGEFGVPAMSNKDKDNTIFYMKSVAEAAYDYGMCPILWDTTSNYSYYNRYTCSMSEFASLKEAFSNILK